MLCFVPQHVDQHWYSTRWIYRFLFSYVRKSRCTKLFWTKVRAITLFFKKIYGESNITNNNMKVCIWKFYHNLIRHGKTPLTRVEIGQSPLLDKWYKANAHHSPVTWLSWLWDKLTTNPTAPYSNTFFTNYFYTFEKN